MLNYKKILEMNIAGGMNSYVRSVIGDDDITDYWNMFGVPDKCDEEMLEELLEVPGCFSSFCKAFVGCLKMNEESQMRSVNNDFTKMKYLLKINNIPHRITKMWNDDNEQAGRTIWLSTGHFEFDMNGNLKNIVDY